MKPAHIQQTFTQPHSWQQLKNGQWVRQSLQTRLDEWCPKLFGYHMLKLGGLSCELNTHLSNIPHTIHLDKHHSLRSVISETDALPFGTKSIDAVLLSHQLEYCNDPHRLLREVDNIIVDDGHIIITGTAPISLAGISELNLLRKKQRRLFTSYRVKDWLSVLNYEVVHCEHYGVITLRADNPYTAFLEYALGRCSHTFGMVYFIVARKRTYPLKPIKPHWKISRSHLSPAKVRFNQVSK